MDFFVVVGSVILTLVFSLVAIELARANKFKPASSLVGLAAVFGVSALYFGKVFTDFDDKWVYLVEILAAYLVIGIFYSFFMWFRYSKSVIQTFAKYSEARQGQNVTRQQIVDGYNNMMKNSHYRYPLEATNRKALILTFWLGWPYYFVRDLFKNPLILIGKVFTKIFGPVFSWLSKQAEKSS